MTEQEHRPYQWVLVATTEDTVILSSECSCGNEKCAWTISSYKDQWFNWVNE